LREHFRAVEDLLILLTGSHYRLDWPFISLDDDQRVRWYFQRFSGDDVPSAPKWNECWTNFPELRDAFGTIWSNWKTKREVFGLGFNMYLSIIRGVSLYTEHRFVNLVWGIEAFHRTRHPTAGSEKIKERIDNVLSEISKPKDKKWLQQKLKHSHEPTLEQRIFEILKSIPLDIDLKRLRAFATSCAKARNELSHFGGHRQGAHNAFSQNLHNLSEVLSILYRCLLLIEIGVDSTIAKRRLRGIGGLESTRIRWYMAEVGLIDKASPRRGR
jgi:ApeA N-terminal domain 1